MANSKQSSRVEGLGIKKCSSSRERELGRERVEGAP
jgi:hypothetical protein